MKDDDFRDKLEDASEALKTLVTSSSSMTERYFELDHAGHGTCESCAASQTSARMNLDGQEVAVCTSCGYERPRGAPPVLPPSAWFKIEV